MTGRNDILQKVDEAMDSVSGIPHVASNPFLFEKIKDRMEEAGNTPERPSQLVPAFRLAAICLMLLLNGWFIGSYGFYGAKTEQAISDTDVEYIMESYAIETGNASIYN